MTPSLTMYETLLACLSLVMAYLIYRALNSPNTPYPPGPRPYPFIGNLLEIPTSYQERAFVNLAKIYGVVIHLRIFTNHLIVLSSFEGAQELLEKRSAIYSSRPRFVLYSEMMGWDRSLTFLPYGDKQRKHTRLMHEGLNPTALQTQRQLQEYEAVVLLQEFATTPNAFRSHFRRYTASLILHLASGHRVYSTDDEYVQISETAVSGTTECGNPGSQVVDLFPALKYLPAWFPGMAFKRHALKVQRDVENMENMLFDEAKEHMKLGSTTSLIARLLESHTHDGQVSDIDIQDIKGAAGTLYAAAVDTSISILETFFLAMLHYPDVYRKAQEEIDRVIGNERLPDLTDRHSLPYLEALVMELYRWNPPVTVGIPHASTENDQYLGYHIPKGAFVMANLWGLARDPEIYDEPESFRPERFIDGKALDPKLLVFGFGRRICPGRAFADMNIWLAVASITACFKISSNGVIGDPKFTSGLVSHPDTFECVIEPRFGNTVELILQTSAAREI